MVNYAEILHRELIANGVKIGPKIEDFGAAGTKITSKALNGSDYKQMMVDALPADFNEESIIRLARVIAAQYDDISFSNLILPHDYESEIQEFDRVILRIIVDFPRMRDFQLLKRCDVMFQDNLAEAIPQGLAMS